MSLILSPSKTLPSVSKAVTGYNLERRATLTSVRMQDSDIDLKQALFTRPPLAHEVNAHAQ